MPHTHGPCTLATAPCRCIFKNRWRPHDYIFNTTYGRRLCAPERETSPDRKLLSHLPLRRLRWHWLAAASLVQVSAMGLTGYEGVFRNSLEVTMSVLRDNRCAIPTVMSTMLFFNDSQEGS